MTHVTTAKVLESVTKAKLAACYQAIA